jgi:hypothetical protein
MNMKGRTHTHQDQRVPPPFATGHSANITCTFSATLILGFSMTGNILTAALPSEQDCMPMGTTVQSCKLHCCAANAQLPHLPNLLLPQGEPGFCFAVHVLQQGHVVRSEAGEVQHFGVSRNDKYVELRFGISVHDHQHFIVMINLNKTLDLKVRYIQCTMWAALPPLHCTVAGWRGTHLGTCCALVTQHGPCGWSVAAY